MDVFLDQRVSPLELPHLSIAIVKALPTSPADGASRLAHQPARPPRPASGRRPGCERWSRVACGWGRTSPWSTGGGGWARCRRITPTPSRHLHEQLRQSCRHPRRARRRLHLLAHGPPAPGLTQVRTVRRTVELRLEAVVVHAPMVLAGPGLLLLVGELAERLAEVVEGRVRRSIGSTAAGSHLPSTRSFPSTR